MAIALFRVVAGEKGKALPHYGYITAQQKYAKKNAELVVAQSGNMPDWAEKDPSLFWELADTEERANGSSYREHLLSLPREFNQHQQLALVQAWIDKQLGDKHPYTFAIHNPKAKDGLDQPHCHLMFCERMHDNIKRSPAQFFKRYNSKNPEKGGAKKANTGLTHQERQEKLLQLREAWGELLNAHLLQHGFTPDIDMRNWQERGLDKKPLNKSMAQCQIEKRLTQLENEDTALQQLIAEDTAKKEQDRLKKQQEEQKAKEEAMIKNQQEQKKKEEQERQQQEQRKQEELKKQQELKAKQEKAEAKRQAEALKKEQEAQARLKAEQEAQRQEERRLAQEAEAERRRQAEAEEQRLAQERAKQAQEAQIKQWLAPAKSRLVSAVGKHGQAYNKQHDPEDGIQGHDRIKDAYTHLDTEIEHLEAFLATGEQDPTKTAKFINWGTCYANAVLTKHLIRYRKPVVISHPPIPSNTEVLSAQLDYWYRLQAVAQTRGYDYQTALDKYPKKPENHIKSIHHQTSFVCEMMAIAKVNHHRDQLPTPDERYQAFINESQHNRQVFLNPAPVMGQGNQPKP